MRGSSLAGVVALGVAVAVVIAVATRSSASVSQATIEPALYSSLPSHAAAKDLLNATHHHPEWVRVAAQDRALMTVVSYPDRPDGAAVVVVVATGEKLTPWVRAVADQLTYEGYIAVVPDAFAADHAGVAAAMQQLAEHPAASGRTALVTLDSDMRIDSGGSENRFALSEEAWPVAMNYLQSVTGNDRSKVVRLPGHGGGLAAHDAGHAGHAAMAAMALAAPTAPGVGNLMGAAPPAGAAGAPGGLPRGYPVSKLDDLPAGLFTAKTTLLRSSIKSEEIDIPTPGVYNGRIHTRITYPEGNDRAGIIVLMQHGPGNDDWMHAVGDQLSKQGFIALSPDLHTGMGPNGGNYESFAGPEDIFAALARLNPEMTLAAYEAVRQYGLKLPRANGKSASLGFCMGGGNSWTMAMNAPDLNAAVAYYGSPRPDEAALAKIKAPIIAFSGTDDARVTAGAEQLAGIMKKLGKPLEFHVYEHATHGFLEFQDLGGNAAATRDSWDRTIAFLRQNLR